MVRVTVRSPPRFLRRQPTVLKPALLPGCLADLCNNERNQYDGGDCTAFNDRDDAESTPAGLGESSADAYSLSNQVDEFRANMLHVCPQHWVGDGECDAVCDKREQQPLLSILLASCLMPLVPRPHVPWTSASDCGQLKPT